MDAERINTIADTIDDLKKRGQQLRRYL